MRTEFGSKELACAHSTTIMPRPPALFVTTYQSPHHFSNPQFPQPSRFPSPPPCCSLHSSLPALHLGPLTSRPDPSPTQLPPPLALAASPPPSPGPTTLPGRLTLMPCSTRTCSRSSSPKDTLLPPWLLSLPPMPAGIAGPLRAPVPHRLPAAPLRSQRLPTYPPTIGGGRGLANSAARRWSPGAVHAGGCSQCPERAASPAPPGQRGVPLLAR